MERKTLLDVFTDWEDGGGIFTYLQSLDVPWKTLNIASRLDLEYYGNVSGDKLISPLVGKLIEDGILPVADRASLASMILSLNTPNWAKLWATLSAEYNPIENYSMVETMEDDETVIEYGKIHTRTDDTTEEQTPDLTTENNNSVYGFNSSNPVPTGDQTQTNTGTNTITNTGTVEDKDEGSDTHTRNYTLTRKGNIGVTTSQQMLESERMLWVWNYFREVVFPEIDRVLTLRIY